MEGFEGFAGRVAVVTGAASGIGLALAGAFAEQGLRVVAADVDESGLCQGLASLPAPLRTNVVAFACDVSSRSSVAALAEFAYAEFGAVHLLCNNAGILGPDAELMWEVEASDWQRVLAVNFYGVVHGISEFVPRMIAGGEPGYVVNTSSMAAFTAAPALHTPYVVSKHGVIGLSEALRTQLAEQTTGRIRAAVLCPGLTRTAIWGDRAANLRPGRTSDVTTASSGIAQVALEPSDTAAAVVAALGRGDFWIFPNAESGRRVSERYNEIYSTVEDRAGRPAPDADERRPIRFSADGRAQ